MYVMCYRVEKVKAKYAFETSAHVRQVRRPTSQKTELSITIALRPVNAALLDACFLLLFCSASFQLRELGGEGGHVPPKCRLAFNGLHDVTLRKAALTITAAVGTSYPTVLRSLLYARLLSAVRIQSLPRSKDHLQILGIRTRNMHCVFARRPGLVAISAIVLLCSVTQIALLQNCCCQTMPCLASLQTRRLKQATPDVR
jgi:hypothetical protein